MKKDKWAKLKILYYWGSDNDGILFAFYLKLSKLYCKDIQPD